MGSRRSPVNDPHRILIDPVVREYHALLEIARRQVAADPAILDKERTARRLVEAYYQGQLDRERLAAVPA